MKTIKVVFEDGKEYKYNSEFDVKIGDKVYVDGKKSGMIGTVSKIKMKLDDSDYMCNVIEVLSESNNTINELSEEENALYFECSKKDIKTYNGTIKANLIIKDNFFIENHSLFYHEFMTGDEYDENISFIKIKNEEVPIYIYNCDLRERYHLSFMPFEENVYFKDLSINNISSISVGNDFSIKPSINQEMLTKIYKDYLSLFKANISYNPLISKRKLRSEINKMKMGFYRPVYFGSCYDGYLVASPLLIELNENVDYLLLLACVKNLFYIDSFNYFNDFFNETANTYNSKEKTYIAFIIGCNVEEIILLSGFCDGYDEEIVTTKKVLNEHIVLPKIPSSVTYDEIKLFKKMHEEEKIDYFDFPETPISNFDIKDNYIVGCKSALHNIRIPNGLKIKKPRFSLDQIFHSSALQIMVYPDSMVKIHDNSFYAFTDLYGFDTGNGVTEIEEYAFGYCRSLRTIRLSKKLIKIGFAAFSDCHHLENIEFPNALKIIDRYAFADCMNIKEVIFPEGLEIIGEGAFSGCKKLKTIYISNSVKEIRKRAFDRCDCISKVYYNGYFCDLLKSFDENFDRYDYYELLCSTILVSKLHDNEAYDDEEEFNGNKFYLINKCYIKELKKINISSLSNNNQFKTIVIANGIKIIDLNYLHDCNIEFNGSLEELIHKTDGKLPSSYSKVKIKTLSNNSSILGIGQIYRDRNRYINTSKVFYNGSFFDALEIDSSLEKLVFDANYLEFGKKGNIYFKGSIEDWCNLEINVGKCRGRWDRRLKYNIHFWNSKTGGYYLLTVLDVPESVNIIKKNQFYGFDKITKIVIRNPKAIIEEEAFDCPKATEVQLGENVQYNEKSFIVHDSCVFKPIKEGEKAKFLKTISNYKVNNGILELFKITSVDIVIPDEVHEIKPKLFYTKDFKSVLFSSEVSKIGANAFAYCHSLEKVTLNEKLKIIEDNAFTLCDSINSISLPDSVEGVGKEVFKGCKKLKYVRLGNNLRNIGSRMFYECDELAKVDFGENIEIISKEAFAGLKKLQDVFLGNNVKVIEKHAFLECDFSNIHLSEKLEHIGEEAFKNCKNFETLELGSNIKVVERAAFCNCIGLKNIIMNKGIEKIENTVFYGCVSLEKVFFKGTIDDWYNIQFSNYDSTPLFFAKEFYILSDDGDYFFEGNNYKLLKEIRLSNGIKEIDDIHFRNMAFVEKIIIPNSVDSIKSAAFNGCGSVVEVEVPFVGDRRHNENDNLQYCFGYIFGINNYENAYSAKQNYVDDNGVLKSRSHVLPKNLAKVVITDTTIIPEGAFFGCKSLDIVAILSDVKNIKNEDFVGCSFLKELYLPDSLINQLSAKKISHYLSIFSNKKYKTMNK